MSEAQYEEERVRVADGIKSRRKDEEYERRLDAERAAMNDLKWKDPGRYYVEREKRERRERDLDLRRNGWTQEQIEAADRADAAVEEWRQKNPEPKGPSHFGPLITQEEKDVYDAWLQKGRAARLRIYGELPPRGSGFFGQDNTQEEKNAHDTWRRNIHARVSSQHEQEPGADATADASATEKASRLRAPTPRATKNASRKTRGGRITKNAAQSQNVANRGTRSQRTAPTLVQASVADRRSKRARASDVVDKPDESSAQVPRKTRKRQPKIYKKRASDAVHDIDDQVLQSKPNNTRQRKVYKQERGSRSLAGHFPEYGMLPKRGKPAPPYEPPSNTRKPNPSGPRSRASSKKSIAVKGAKPRGISKSGGEGTNRPKRSKKQSEG